MSEIILPFTMEEQTQDLWCWAATTKAVSEFYPPHTPIGQCDVASLVKPDNCCASPSTLPCNDVHVLSEPLQKTKNFKDFLPTTILWSKIKKEISAGKIVCAFIQWNGTTSGHYVAIHGVAGDGRNTKIVYVRDPDGEDTNMDYDEFKTYGGQGTWLTTYFTKKSPRRN